MRGKVNALLQSVVTFGITPAYAGKSKRFNVMLGTRRDHPRLCGEKISRNCYNTCTKGSPPPMRGKAPSKAKEAASGRITPAYAGKSLLMLMVYATVKDHPRLCGEKTAPLPEICRQPGSPPPMRGKDDLRLLYSSCPRITPAYAGKSVPPAFSVSEMSGSPPPMRGKVKL